MTDSIDDIQSHTLTFGMLKDLGFNKDMQERIGITDYIDDEQLADSDWIITPITINNKLYALIHGFPGDTPLGLIYNHSTAVLLGAAIGTLLKGVNAGSDEDREVLETWYNDVTQDGSTYEQSFWYAQQK